MIVWCNEKFNFWPTDSSLSPAEENWLKNEVVKKGLKRFTQTCLVLYHMASRMQRKTEVLHVLMTVFIHLHFPMHTNAPTRKNIFILNLGLENMLIDGRMSLSQEKSHQVRKI